MAAGMTDCVCGMVCFCFVNIFFITICAAKNGSMGDLNGKR